MRQFFSVIAIILMIFWAISAGYDVINDTRFWWTLKTWKVVSNLF